MGAITVGVDVGGTKIQSAAMVSEKIAGGHRLMTPHTGAPDVAAAIAEAVSKALAEAGAQPSDLHAVGLGAPGAIDTDDGTVSSSPNLPGFQGDEPVPLGAMVSELLGGVRVKLDNDVRVGILGEWKRGAGRGYRNLLGVWVGTGVGGGLVLDDELYEGQGAAGEIGHTIVKPGGRVCSDGRRGHLEAYAGRARLEVQARHLHKQGHKTDLFDIMKRKGRTRLSSGVWAEALEKDDKMAVELIEDAVEALGIAPRVGAEPAGARGDRRRRRARRPPRAAVRPTHREGDEAAAVRPRSPAQDADHRVRRSVGRGGRRGARRRLARRAGSGSCATDQVADRQPTTSSGNPGIWSPAPPATKSYGTPAHRPGSPGYARASGSPLSNWNPTQSGDRKPFVS